MKETNDGATMIRFWETPLELTDDVASIANVAPKALLSKSFSGRQFGKDYEGSWQTAIEYARERWEPGLATVDGMLKDIDREVIPRPKSRRRRPCFSETDGAEVDYDRLRAGQEFWRTARREKASGLSTITVITELTTPWRIDSKNILWRGAAAIALVKRLEEAGYRVELWSAEYTIETYLRGPRDTFHAVCLKRSSDPLDVATLVTAVAGWFYRSIVLAVNYLDARTPNENLGKCRPMPAKYLDLVAPTEGRYVVSSAFNQDNALDRIKEILRELS